ncbi:MAG: DNA adenine methylase [Anaerovoracaceae bacterium]
MKPFIKWAGGKGQLLKEMRKNYPVELGKSITKYCEPFVGGGAVLFDILESYELNEIYINDINAELINTYRMVQENVSSLIGKLMYMQNEYIPLDTIERKEYYYHMRQQFNDEKTNGDKFINLDKAALFIFLNKTCFNGLYRVNSKGGFNVPMGAYKNPMICDENNLMEISRALQNVQIHCGDYSESASFVDENTFVYFDPPYRPLTETASFTSYTENAFDDTAQIALAQYVGELTGKGSKIVVSNSDPKNINEHDNFFDILYEAHKIQRVEAKRMINCQSESRGTISELLIANFR